MPQCEHLGGCPFFNDAMRDMPSTSEWLKGLFCRGTYEQCARYSVLAALGPHAVPIDMFPDDRQRARQIIADVITKV